MSFQKGDFSKEIMEDAYQTRDVNYDQTHFNDDSNNNDFNKNQNIKNNNDFLKFVPISSKKIPLTFIYCISFWNFGICVAIFGPTLLDLACQTSSTLSAMSLLYFMQNFTSLIGCFVSGILVKNKKFEINDVLLMSTFAMPICISLMPFARHVFFLGLVMIFLGFFMGCIDNIANLGILKLHSNNVSPFIQTMHFFYGIGAFLTPIVVKFFLNSNFDFTTTSSSFNCYNIEDVQDFIKQKPYIPSLNNAKQESVFVFNQSILNPEQILPEMLMTKTQFTSQTKYAFWILALIQLPAPLILLIIKLGPKKLDDYTDIEEQNNETTNNENNSSNTNQTNEHNSFSFSLDYVKSLLQNIPVLKMILLMSLLVFFFEGLQASHGGYIFSYTVEKYDIKPSKFSILKNDTKSKLIINRHHHQHSDDAFITATFWAFFSIGRLISIFIATKFSSSFMLTIDIVGCLFASIVMIFSSFFGTLSLLYLSTCLLGLFLSNTTPTSYSLAEIHIGMTPTLTSFIIICAASGEMIFPLIVAFLFESVGPNSLIAVEFLISIAAALAFTKFILYAKTHAKAYDSRDSFIWLNPITSETNKSNQNKIIGKSSNNYYSKMEEESD